MPPASTPHGRPDVDEALRQALASCFSPRAGSEMVVVTLPRLARHSLLHEAIGHGCEGDFNRKLDTRPSTGSGEADRGPRE